MGSNEGCVCGDKKFGNMYQFFITIFREKVEKLKKNVDIDVSFGRVYMKWSFSSRMINLLITVIIGLCSTPNEIRANIVLAGDPKQLDAVCKSTIVAKFGFNTSFLERLFKRPLYMKQKETKKFNTKHITQLVKNYRSHDAIYDGTLLPEASKGEQRKKRVNGSENKKITPFFQRIRIGLLAPRYYQIREFR